ncbi:hypothetical protein KM92DES2_12254 [uncultured Desulfovibrio sp.]|uniref:Uncharacterized protein n=1 Tax=uncultured Desulfovibrio sp. TaxID=167968 RepID=A0A212K5G4_9BACT|nr:hypothetical protein KM92DES2_12254 [uncultured Desulfovibrio sp.]
MINSRAVLFSLFFIVLHYYENSAS